MLRLGLGLGCRSVRAVLAQQQSAPFTPLTSAPILNFFQSRTYAKSDKGQELKKQKYMGAAKVKVAKKHFKSGTRLKRVDWLDTPRKPKKQPQKKMPIRHKFFTLNTDKRITKHTNELKDPKKIPHIRWLNRLAHQVRTSPENAAALTEIVLTHPKLKQEKIPPKTFTILLDLWYRRKDLSKATEVFNHMKANNKSTDYSYAIYAKTLATRGELGKAKEILAERESHAQLKGCGTLKTMINYVAADNIKDGIQLMERLKTLEKPDRSVYSTIIGWCLKYGEVEAAETYFKELKENYLLSTFKPAKDDVEHEERLRGYNKAMQERHKLLAEWGKKLRNMDKYSQGDGLSPQEVTKIAGQPDNRVPKLPPLPLYPHRLTEEEFLDKFPVPLTPHLLRSLIDMEQERSEIPSNWLARLKKSLGWKAATKDIKGLAHKISLKDKTRYEYLQSVLQKIGLPVEELTYVPPPRVKGTAPIPRRKKVPVVKKWWKKDRTVFEKKE